MSSAGAANILAAGSPGVPGAGGPPGPKGDVPLSGPPRSFSAIVVRQTFAGWGARLGLCWVSVLTLAAVFAPFIANSYPLLLKTGGRWSSPLLEHLTAADVILLVAFFTGLVLLALRTLPAGARWRLWVWTILVSLVLVGWPALAPTLAYGLGAWFDDGVRILATLAVLTLVTLRLSRVPLPRWLKIIGGAVIVAAFWWACTRSFIASPLVATGGKLSRAVILLSQGWHVTAVKGAAGAALFIGGVLLLVRRRAGGLLPRTGAVLWLAAVAVAFTLLTINPAITQVFEQYRQLEQVGQVQWALHTPVPYSPTDRLRQTDYEASHRIAPATPFQRPSAAHWMGTDDNAQDVFARILHAARIALAIGLIATTIEVIVGVTIGGLMGYFVGWVDLLGMRLIEIIEAVPTLFLLITFVAFFDRNIYVIMGIIGLTGWTGNARFIRAEFLRLRQQDFVVAAQACGLPLRSILFRHMLPNGMAPVLVGASFGIAAAILYEATLTFLGLGLPPGEPSWGQLLNQARGTGGGNWWILLYPGLVIFLTVFSYNLIGEALRDAIDPHSRRVAQL